MRFRRDIEGLRAVAVALVVLFHAGLPWLPGGYIGVDVFFVISGYLMTSIIVRDLERTGTVSFRRFYARRIRRLLPAAVLVLIVTVLAAKLVLPPLALPDVGAAAAAAALFAANIWFARQYTDYLADQNPSLVQHYWSLGVEEQFYLVWPALLLVLFRVGRRRLRWLLPALAGGAVLSFLLCVVVTDLSQPWAFFSLPTRAWELAVGALVALSDPRWARLPALAARVLSWGGLATIVVAGAALSSDTTFPGWIAAVPVAATAVVLIGGAPAATGTAVTLLARRPFQAVGRVSYSLYLWHWPVLLLPVAAWGVRAAWERALLVVLAVALAGVTYRWVEDPIRRAGTLSGRPRRAFVLGGGLTAAGVAAALAVTILPPLATDRRVPPLTAELALQQVPPPDVVPANVTPALAAANDDVPPLYSDGCHADFLVVRPGRCVYGDLSATRTMVLIGDSHAAQWFTALEEIARRSGWRLVNLTKSACPAADLAVRSDVLEREYTECATWREAAVRRIRDEAPALVVVGNYSNYYAELVDASGDYADVWSAGLGRFVDRLAGTTRVVVLGDTPSWPRPPAECLSAHLEEPAACARPLASVVPLRLLQQEQAAVVSSRGTYLSTAEWICTDVCQVLARNVVIYRDDHHLTETMSRLLAVRLRLALSV